MPNNKMFCLLVADTPAGTFVEQVYSWGGEADEENAPESGRFGQSKDTGTNKCVILRANTET